MKIINAKMQANLIGGLMPKVKKELKKGPPPDSMKK